MIWIKSIVLVGCHPLQNPKCQVQHYSVYEVVQMSLFAINLLVFGCRTVKKLFDADGFAGRSIAVKWHARAMLATYNSPSDPSSSFWRTSPSVVNRYER
jgi:hypothetical protein